MIQVRSSCGVLNSVLGSAPVISTLIINVQRQWCKERHSHPQLLVASEEEGGRWERGEGKEEEGGEDEEEGGEEGGEEGAHKKTENLPWNLVLSQ